MDASPSPFSLLQRFWPHQAPGCCGNAWLQCPPPYQQAGHPASPAIPRHPLSRVTRYPASPTITCHPPSRITHHPAANLSKEKDASGNAARKPTPHPRCPVTRISLGRQSSQRRQPQLRVLKRPSPVFKTSMGRRRARLSRRFPARWVRATIPDPSSPRGLYTYVTSVPLKPQERL